MAIYTHFGSKVTLCDARMIPVWVEHKPYETKWHYKPAKPGKKSTVEEMPVWHYRGWYEDGKPVCDNKWVNATNLRADDGWNEIEAKLLELCPDAEEKYEEWDKSSAPSASHFFPPVSPKEVA